MQNHKQDDFDGGRAPSLIEHADPRERWSDAGAKDDLAFVMAMLAMAEGAGRHQEPTDGRAPKETSHGRAEDAARAGPSSSGEGRWERLAETFEEDAFSLGRTRR